MIRGYPRDVWFLRPPGVYAPQGDTSLLREALLREAPVSNAHVLDVGTGTGTLALAAARLGAGRVTAIDASYRAVLTTRLNALLAGLPVRVHHGDLLTPVTDRSFDLIMANPPYVPSPDPTPPTRGRARAWDAGTDGRAVLDRFCANVPPLLRPGGVVLLVHSGMCDPDLTLRPLARAGLHAEVTDRRRVPFGPVLTERAAWLRGRDLLGTDEDREELVIVRAQRLV